MQHAAGIDQVEASADRFELENIGLVSCAYGQTGEIEAGFLDRAKFERWLSFMPPQIAYTESDKDEFLISDGGHATRPAFGGEAFDLQARRRREVVGARLGRRALALDDAAQALTFALRAAAGRERTRNVAALRALKAARSGDT